MKVYTAGGQNYRLSNSLNDFQLEMQVHLVNWKWDHITGEPMMYRGQPNDALFPELFANQFPMLYPAIQGAFKRHKQSFSFRLHPFFNHVASSQIANFNLFLPILLNSNVNAVLGALKSDFARLASSELDHGYRFEYWDDTSDNLGDHNHLSGTDADIAIAYYNHQDELCLWLIEHKLTEKEFTTCGGFKSKGRRANHDCGKSFSDILADKSLCYCHDIKHFNYWKITETNLDFFPNQAHYARCPFQGGLYQLWRNQLLGLSIEQDERQPYEHVAFSVVKHPENTSLDATLDAYQELIAYNPKFSVFTSADVIAAASAINDAQLDEWIVWYKTLYNL